MATFRYAMLQFSAEYDWSLCTLGYYERKDQAIRASQRALVADSAVTVVSLVDASRPELSTRGQVPADIASRVSRGVDVVRDYERDTLTTRSRPIRPKVRRHLSRLSS